VQSGLVQAAQESALEELCRDALTALGARLKEEAR
jgi:hypothetical protein